MKSRYIPTLATLGVCLFFTGCSGDFDPGDVPYRTAQSPIQVDSEQVSLTLPQVACGVSNELWEDAVSAGNERKVYRRTQKGRDLQFSDDIYADDPDYPGPYTQVRGTFSLSMASIAGIHDGPDGASKLIQAAIGVRIPHMCFPNPLPIMGVSKGKFTPTLAPTLLYENTEKGWGPAKLVH
jgi:hypothetical protein